MEPAPEASGERNAIRATFGDHGDVAALARELDWSNTALGVVHRWSSLLRSIVRLAVASPQPVCVCWGPDAIAIWNDASVTALRGQLRAVFARPLFTSFPEAIDYARPITARVLRGDSVIEFRRHVPLIRDGKLEDAWFDLECTPIREADGSVAGSFNVWRERTTEVMESRNQEMLTHLADALRSLADPIEIEKVAIRMLAEHLKLTRVMYGEVESDDEHIRFDRSYVAPGAPEILGRFRMRNFGERLVPRLLRGETLVIESIASASELSLAEREAYATLGIAALVGVPLVKQSHFVAVISVQDAKPRRWTQADVALIEETAERTWAAGQRARAEAARTKAEAALHGSDARDSYLLALSDRLRSLRDPLSIQTAAAEILANHLRVTRSYYAEYDEDAGLAYVRSESAHGDVPTAIGVYRLADFAGQVMQLRTGTPLVVEDWREAGLSKAGAAELAKRQARAQITVPLVKEGKLVAALSVNDVRPRRWSDRDVELVTETAERTWAAVERARVELALRQSEQRARTLLAEATEARALAEAANRAKDEFLATLSHELRTPLAAIHLWAGALRSGAVSMNDLTRAIDAIAQSAESLSQLIEDLLDLSRLTSGKLVLSRSSVDVEYVSRTALETVKPLAIAKGIVLWADIDNNLGLAVLDGTRLKQVLWNLLTNAVKFTPAGGQATLRTRRVDDNLELEVMDTGEGIAPEFLPHVFERFRQADMAETRQHTGLGIGLALAKQLVELHGGTIAACSAGLGRGATFRVRLPFVSPETLEPEGAAHPLAIGMITASPLAGLGVLLVEDDTKTLDAMRWTLERAGAIVNVAASAREALTALERDSGNDVIVSDLGLPGMSGFELMERIVEQHRKCGRRPPPSCAVSAHVREMDRRRAIEAGFDMYLTKPVTPGRLVEAVTDLRDILAANRGRTTCDE
jgi:signal transduction histidine kinase/ActR/RegA family two-component response regulator